MVWLIRGFNQEKTFRLLLENQTPKTLLELATKSKKEILTFLLVDSKKDITKTKIKEDNKRTAIESRKATETQKIQTKLSKIKSLFISNILANNPDIAEKLEILEGLDEPLKKERVLQEILQILKNPWRLKAIIDRLGGADKGNPHYVEFKSALLGLDSSFEKYFNDLENISWWISLGTDEVVESVEWDSGGIIDIDLSTNPPLSKMSLIWSDYSFDEELDKQALFKLETESKGALMAVQKGFALLKGLHKPFDVLLSQIRQIWGKPHFLENLKSVVGAFAKDSFADLGSMYEEMGIKSENQIDENDITSLGESHSQSDLRQKIETIKTKLEKIKEQLTAKKSWIVQEYQTHLKSLIQKGSVEKKKELEVLHFMHSSGYDLFPKEITDRLIVELKSTMLIIPWLDLSISNIDLKNGNFGESSAFIDKDKGLSIEAKRNLVKFVNKMISWKINEPLNIDTIANGTAVIDPLELKHILFKAGLTDGLGWKYSKVLGNLRTQ